MGPDGSIRSMLDHDQEAYLEVVLENPDPGGKKRAGMGKPGNFRRYIKKYDQYRFMKRKEI